MPTYRTDSDLPNGGSTKNVDVKWDDLGGAGTFNGGGLSTKGVNKTIPSADVGLRKPTTGLPPVVVVDEWSTSDDGNYTGDPTYREWKDDVRKKTSPIPPKEEKSAPRNVLPIPEQKTPPPTFVDQNKKYWVWNECNKRWWTPDSTGKPRENTVFNGQNSGMGSNGGGLGTNGPQSFGGSSVPNQYIDAGEVMWSSWDAFNSQWIRRTANNWCTPEDKFGVPPEDDCAKYGRNCPDPLPTGKVFTRIDRGDRLPRREEVITYGIWSDNSGSLNRFYTCSIAQTSSSFSRAVLQSPCGNCDAEVQFDIAYGHDAGSGSRDLGGYDWLTPTNAVYDQYKLLCVDNDKPWFTIGGRRLNHVYIVNIRRSRMQDKLDEGNLELNLAHLSGSKFEAGGGLRNAHTGSNVKVAGNGQVLRLIDDSKLDYLNTLSNTALSSSYSEIGEDKARLFTGAGEVFYMISGSLELGAYNPTNPSVYGLMYPRLGVIVLDGDKLDSDAGFLSVTGSDVAGDNNYKLFTAISGAALYTDDSGDIMGFQARRKKTEYSEYYFIRVKNGDYNFTNNASYQTGSYGEIIADFQGNPKVYITAIGLYNEQKELIGVGKLSRPILKDYVNEALFSVKLGL